MSNTFSHKKKILLKRYYKERWDSEYEKYERYGYDFEGNRVPINFTVYLPKAGVKPKIKKCVDDKDKWYKTTPSWFVNMFMTRPQRRSGTLWEREALKTSLEELSDIDTPLHGKKPHIYYY